MTALAERRSRATRLAGAATALALVVVVIAGLIGARALYNSTDGSDARGAGRDIVSMPDTPNALVGVVDDDGELASLAVFTLRPETESGDESSGIGGSIVVLPTAAAVLVGGEEMSLADRFDGSSETLESDISSMLGVGFDRTVIIDRRELAELLSPVEAASVILPTTVVDDDSTGSPLRFEAGEHAISGADAATLLTARPGSDDVLDGALAYEHEIAVWTAISTERSDAAADRGATDGAGSAAEGVIGESTKSSLPRGFHRLMETLFSGQVTVRGLNVASTSADAPSSLLSVDRVDALVVFGQVSPRKVAAPFPSYNVRVVAPFADSDLVVGTGADVAYRAVELLVAAEVNVVSVSTAQGEVPVVTRLDVVNNDSAPFAEILGADLFGEYTTGEASRDLAGIDFVITLGESFLATSATDVDADADTHGAGELHRAADGRPTEQDGE